jgi:hypothetical protein
MLQEKQNQLLQNLVHFLSNNLFLLKHTKYKYERSKFLK